MSSLAPVESSVPEPAVHAPSGPALDHVLAHRFERSVASADLIDALEAYTEAPSWEDRWFCIEHMAQASPDMALLDSWCEGWDQHVLPFLARGAARAAAADARAFDDLDVAATLDPANPIPWGQRIVAARAMGQPASDMDRDLEEMVPRSALYQPHVEYLLALGPANGGAPDALIGFARNVCDVVPAGSPLRAVMPLAALEAMLADAPADHHVYLRDAGLYDDVLMAAGQSVFHPEFEGQATIPSLKALNAFAVALSILGQDDLALLLTERIGSTFTEWPLSLLGPATETTWQSLCQRLAAKAPEVAAANSRA